MNLIKNKYFLLIIAVVLLPLVAFFTEYAFRPFQPITNSTSNSQDISRDNKEFTLKIGYAPFPSPLLIAYEKGFFSKANIQVVLEPVITPNLTLESLARGDIDLAQVPYSILFTFQSVSPGKFKIMADMIETEESPYSFLIVKNSINSPKDLSGKKIVIRTGYNSKIQAESIIKGLGLDLTEVTLVPVEMPLLVTTFVKEEISGFIDLEPAATVILEKQLGKNMGSALRAKYITSPYPTAAVIINAKLVSEKPDMARKVKQAIDEAIDFSISDDKETRFIYQKYLGVDENVTAKISLPRNEKLEDIDRQVAKKLIDFELKNGILSKEPNFDEVYLY